jgi:hypothetical protein
MIAMFMKRIERLKRRRQLSVIGSLSVMRTGCGPLRDSRICRRELPLVR